MLHSCVSYKKLMLLNLVKHISKYLYLLDWTKRQKKLLLTGERKKNTLKNHKSVWRFLCIFKKESGTVKSFDLIPKFSISCTTWNTNIALAYNTLKQSHNPTKRHSCTVQVAYRCCICALIHSKAHFGGWLWSPQQLERSFIYLFIFKNVWLMH